MQSWGEISYDELADLIADGRLDDYLDWQGRYSALIAGTLAPLWSDAITAASRKATAGKVVLYDSNDYVRAWLETHGGELITQLSRESQKAVAMVILLGQSNRMAPRDIAKQVRPLIGLNERQAAANLNYREKVYNKYREQGMGEVKARERADKAAIKYAGKQHRFRAETIVHTELAFAYNRGAHMGVSQGIADGLMGRCAMKWSTAGTNRVCSRCLALKDTTVGYTDESGVTLPPLHPRCRCAIIYDEVAAPRRVDNKPSNQRGLAAGNIESTTIKGTPPRLIGKLENMTLAIIKKTLGYYEAQIVNAPIENGIIITSIGEIYHCTGDLNTLDSIIELGKELENSYITHNHPIGSVNEYTFGGDDKNFFTKYKPACLRGIDDKFLYELNRNPADNEFAGYELHELYSLGLNFEDPHVITTLWALTKGLGYRREPR